MPYNVISFMKSSKMHYTILYALCVHMCVGIEIYILNIDYSKLAKKVSSLIMIKKYLALFQIA